ncbi:hypothetical protein [Spiroplasma phoeniceum]|uniref:Uncharacterized protein n=1 Tax=Spiroplasma phoeniceum P40 TaxID=1276259 RepID=A0A345DSC7_9MOLU|nr:hypothetical protein [Spiroplasma phoeniceum]AXF97118.1 hypothetical protein SDAV_002185 [Spiroplasma phoeniceum P40]
MLINFLSNITFNRFINFINNIFSSIFLNFYFLIISILIRISFLKTKSIKNINNTFTKFAIISFIFTFISNLSILLVLNIFIQFSFGWIERTTINLLNFIFLLFAIFLSTIVINN